MTGVLTLDEDCRSLVCVTSAYSLGQCYLCKLQSHGLLGPDSRLMKMCVRIACGCYQDWGVGAPSERL